MDWIPANPPSPQAGTTNNESLAGQERAMPAIETAAMPKVAGTARSCVPAFQEHAGMTDVSGF